MSFRTGKPKAQEIFCSCLATDLNLKNAIDTDMQQNMSSMLHVQQS